MVVSLDAGVLSDEPSMQSYDNVIAPCIAVIDVTTSSIFITKRLDASPYAVDYTQ